MSFAPQNEELKEIYCDVIKEDGLENGFEAFRNEKDKRFSLIGDYRTLVGKPEDIKYRRIKYANPNENLTVNKVTILEYRL